MSVGGIRLPGLSTGMDTENMVKSMLTREQNKIDKAEQEKQKLQWKQEIYRDVISEVKGLYSKYYDPLSPNYILGSKSFNTTTITSSNSDVVSAISSATNTEVNYKFEVGNLATVPSKSSGVASNGKPITKNAKLSDLGLSGEVTFKIGLGGDKESKEITLKEDATVEDMIKQIKESSDGKVRVSLSEMTGELKIESATTGSSSKLSIKNVDGSVSDALGFLGISGDEVSGSNANVVIKDASGNVLKTVDSEKNSFTIDNVTYSINGVGNASLKGSTDTTKVVENMKNFVNDYNKMIDKVYDLVTERTNKDYHPLTDAQRDEMSEEEIERWEAKAKQGILRNDSEFRTFLSDMEKAIGMDLGDLGISGNTDYNKRGQLAFDETKFLNALKNDSQGVRDKITSTLEKSSKVVDSYVGNSSAIFVKKAGMDKTASKVNNLFSEQLRKQEQKIKELTRRFNDRETQLYAQFALLESNMSKLNSQMSYLMQ